jgi:hypothetical protein
VEQQFSKAVAVVLKTRAYADSVFHEEMARSPNKTTRGDDTPASSFVLEILRTVNERSINLASAIKKSLLNLPNSQVRSTVDRNQLTYSTFIFAVVGIQRTK